MEEKHGLFVAVARIEIWFRFHPLDVPVEPGLGRYSLFFRAKIVDTPDVLKLMCLDVICSPSLYRKLLKEARKFVASFTNTKPSQWKTRREGYMIVVERR